jgi:nitrogen fixation NifU-like protein
LVTTLVKGKKIEEAESLNNAEIARELELPPVKIHCSVLAEDAIKAAISNYRKKQENNT